MRWVAPFVMARERCRAVQVEHRLRVGGDGDAAAALRHHDPRRRPLVPGLDLGGRHDQAGHLQLHERNDATEPTNVWHASSVPGHEN